MFDRFPIFENFFTALLSVPLWQVLLEMLIIGAVVYWVVRFLQGTRGARLLKGIVLVLITLYLGVRFVGAILDLSRLQVLFDRFLFYASFAIIIVFQPELRRALMRLGETRLFRGFERPVGDEVDQIVDACATLSRRRIGGLIALERDVALGSLAEEATPIQGEVTSALIQTIFYPNTALHDLGMIIAGGKITYAGVQFPLAESGDLPRELGSRHRAAVGLTQETDALVIVVSEETGDISVADRGTLLRKRTPEQLRELLLERLGESVPVSLEEEGRVRVVRPREKPEEAEEAEEADSETAEGRGGPEDDRGGKDGRQPAAIREVKPVGGLSGGKQMGNVA